MPFRLMNVPVTFERVIGSLLRGVKRTTFLYYVDDILVIFTSLEQQLERSSQVSPCLAISGLQLSKKTSVFAALKVKFLGHDVNRAGVNPGYKHICSTPHFPQPQTQNDFQRFGISFLLPSCCEKIRYNCSTI